MSIYDSRLPVAIFNVSTLSLVDTGASISIMSKPFLNRLQQLSKIKIVEFSEPQTCTVADRAKVKMLGKVELPVYINGLKYNVLFYILPTVNIDVILFFKNTMRHYKLDLKRQHLISLKLLSRRAQIKHNANLEVYPFQDLCRQNVLSATSIVTNYDNCIPVRMTNLSTKPQVIKKGQRIGSARLIDRRNYANPQKLYDTAQHECHINLMSVHDETNTRH